VDLLDDLDPGIFQFCVCTSYAYEKPSYTCTGC